MRQMYKYALVQFMPFVETGEFANVGVIACAPKANFWDFKLAHNRFKRVTDFFKEMDKDVYRIAINRFKEEMEVTKNIALARDINSTLNFFNEITRPRQALIRFSNVRTMLTSDPAQTLENLYDEFIHRDFVDEQYKEQQMVMALRRQFKANRIPIEYTEQRMKVGVREFTIPFVGDTEQGTKLIKPLAFNQKRPTQLFEHGETWFNRLKALLDNNDTQPQNILLPFEHENNLNGERKDAFNEVEKLFSREGIATINYAKQKEIIEFAAA